MSKGKRVFKYGLSKVGAQTMMMPAGAQILSAGLDPHGGVSVWAIHDEENENAQTPRIILVVGTGQRLVGTSDREDGVIDDEPKFVGSVLAGEYVWHVFEIVKVSA